MNVGEHRPDVRSAVIRAFTGAVVHQGFLKLCATRIAGFSAAVGSCGT